MDSVVHSSIQQIMRKNRYKVCRPDKCALTNLIGDVTNFCFGAGSSLINHEAATDAPIMVAEIRHDVC